MILTDAELERYARQVVMPEIGEAGQKKLLNSHVLIIGAGGLGSPVIAALAGAGIGHLTVIDDDHVDLTNLNRQTIHTMDGLNRSKARSAYDFVQKINPDIKVSFERVRFELPYAEQLIADKWLVVDCTDTPQTRYLVNDLCYRFSVPLVFGGAVRTDGQITSFIPEDQNSPCLRCVFPQTELDYDQAPSCASAGILGPITMVIGALQAQEAIKILAGFGQPLKGRLVLYDGLNSSFMEIKTAKDPDCPVCALRAQNKK